MSFELPLPAALSKEDYVTSSTTTPTTTSRT
jgi:hypothetical protein